MILQRIWELLWGILGLFIIRFVEKVFGVKLSSWQLKFIQPCLVWCQNNLYECLGNLKEKIHRTIKSFGVTYLHNIDILCTKQDMKA